ncbi:TPA: hypothetical protein DCW61_01725 [Candidatus Uhrbacteria bacterium]|nr:hypothetical protein [Candidatus Uhrbacteria bacterium]
MSLLRIKGGKLEQIKETELKLEKDLQKLTETNLETVFGLQFVSTEFALNNLRIDTLAYDMETGSFVIIEYKRDRSFSVIDQGFAYLSLMLNNKADFILEYSERIGKHLHRDDIDWSQSRVLFIAQSFTAHQLQAINFKDLPIELWEAKKYSDDLISFNQIKALQSAESIKTVSRDEVVSTVSKEVETISAEEVFGRAKDDINDLSQELRRRIFETDNRFQEKATKRYVAYKIGLRNVISIEPTAGRLNITFTRTRPEDLNDPEGKAKIRNKSFEHYNQYLTDVNVTESGDVDYVISLLKQVLVRFQKEEII